MEWLETTAKTVEDAKDFLLDQLGVDEDEAEFEILEEPKAGLFGRQRGVARVRARIAPKSPRPKDERRRRRGGSKRKGEGKAESQGAARAQEPAAEVNDEPKKEKEPAKAGGSDRNGGRGRGDGGRKQSDRNGDRKDEAPVDPAPFVAPLVSFYEGILQAAGLEGRVTVEITEESELAASIEGERLGSLIGPSGGVIDALQDLGRTFLQKEAKGASSPRMKLDVARYKARRREELAKFATDLAHQVRETGDPRAFEVMGSVDRKTIHDAVNEVEGVQTLSKGEDPDRYVVIAPA